LHFEVKSMNEEALLFNICCLFFQVEIKTWVCMKICKYLRMTENECDGEEWQ